MKSKLTLEREVAIERLKKLCEKLSPKTFDAHCISNKDYTMYIQEKTLLLTNFIKMLEACKSITKVCFHCFQTDSKKLGITKRLDTVTMHLYFPDGVSDLWTLFLELK